MPKIKAGVPIERLRECLSYNPDTGVITWRVRTGGKRKPGQVAGTLLATGYVLLRIDGCSMLAHRVAWAMTHGIWPMHEIDHINRDRSDNRVANLREATRAQNSRNSPHRINNRLGVKGVIRKHNRFLAQIYIDGRTRCIGRFDTIEEASACYQAACAEIGRADPLVSTLPSAPQEPRTQKPRTAPALPSPQELHEWFEYISDGSLVWRKSPTVSVKAGSAVGALTSHGYSKTTIRGRHLMLHRIVWAMHHGAWPPSGRVVSHANKILTDNRIENLVLMTIAEKKASSRIRNNSKVGLRGVTKVGGGFCAQIGYRRKRIFLGTFPTPEEAKAAYDAAHLRLHGRPCPDYSDVHDAHAKTSVPAAADPLDVATVKLPVAAVQ